MTNVVAEALDVSIAFQAASNSGMSLRFMTRPPGTAKSLSVASAALSSRKQTTGARRSVVTEDGFYSAVLAPGVTAQRGHFPRVTLRVTSHAQGFGARCASPE